MSDRGFVRGALALLAGVLASGFLLPGSPDVVASRPGAPAPFLHRPEAPSPTRPAYVPEAVLPAPVQPLEDDWALRFPGAAGMLAGSPGKGPVRTVPGASYEQGLSIEAGGIRVRQRLLGARPAAREGAVYRGVLEGVDARTASRGDAGEEFLRLGQGAPDAFAWTMDLEGEGARFRVSGRSLLALDAGGRARLRLDPSRYWRLGEEGAGGWAESELRLEGERSARLTLRIPAEDRGREVLLDPGWSAAARMVFPHSLHESTLLADGRILVSGGERASPGRVELPTVEAYEPGSGAWVLLASMAQPRMHHRASLLPDGKVLVSGGWSESSLPTCELYDPAMDAWSSAPSFYHGARTGHTATTLRDGRILVAGGDGAGTCEIFDPFAFGGSGEWRPAPPLSQPLRHHAATLLPDGRVMVTGGMTVPDGRPVGPTQIYDPVQDAWSLAGSLVFPRRSHRAVPLSGGRVMVAGGCAPDGSLSAYAEIFDPSRRVWRLANPMVTVPPGAGFRGPITLTPLASGSLLAAGGSDSGVCELYDPETQDWRPASVLASARVSHGADLLPGGGVLASGGNAPSTLTLSSCEIYDGGLNGASRPSAPSGPAVLSPFQTGAFTSLSEGLKPGMRIVYDWGDGSGSATSTGSDAHAWAASGAYRVRCRVEDSDYSVSDWSPPVQVRIDLPPSTPSAPSGPSLLDPGVAGTFTASASDPDDASLTITFDWGDGSATVCAGTAEHAWASPGTYSVRALATDPWGLSSGWSDALAVEVPAPPPPPPPAFLDAGVRVTPKTVNLRARGPVTVRIRIEGVAPSAVDPASLRANGQPAQRTKADADVFKARFERSAVRDLGNGTGEVAVEGSLMDGRAFRGSATVRLKGARDKGGDGDDEDEWR